MEQWGWSTSTSVSTCFFVGSFTFYIGCMCHQHGAKEKTCNIVTGQCECRSNVIGLKCNTCQVSEILSFKRLLVLAFIQLHQHLNFISKNFIRSVFNLKSYFLKRRLQSRKSLTLFTESFVVTSLFLFFA